MKDSDQVNESISQSWGGKWTKTKIDIFIKYLPAYLKIMNKRNYKLVYFDGFAGSGEINPCEYNLIESVALQVLAIDEPRSFDMYYLVELCKEKAESLKKLCKQRFPNKDVYIVSEDCNTKLLKFSEFLQRNTNWRGLAFLDPFGMEINFNSLRGFKNVNCDMWILIPSGGANRLLKKDGSIPESWSNKLTDFLGLSKEDFFDDFYKKKIDRTLFGEEILTFKHDQSVEKLITRYKKQLETIWNYVTEPFPLKNSKGAIIFHFLMVSQFKIAQKIADDIIKKF
jgi:three-Cys-motif partner protein